MKIKLFYQVSVIALMAATLLPHPVIASMQITLMQMGIKTNDPDTIQFFRKNPKLAKEYLAAKQAAPQLTVEDYVKGKQAKLSVDQIILKITENQNQQNNNDHKKSMIGDQQDKNGQPTLGLTEHQLLGKSRLEKLGVAPVIVANTDYDSYAELGDLKRDYDRLDREYPGNSSFTPDNFFTLRSKQVLYQWIQSLLKWKTDFTKVINLINTGTPTAKIMELEEAEYRLKQAKPDAPATPSPVTGPGVLDQTEMPSPIPESNAPLSDSSSSSSTPTAAPSVSTPNAYETVKSSEKDYIVKVFIKGLMKNKPASENLYDVSAEEIYLIATDQHTSSKPNFNKSCSGDRFRATFYFLFCLKEVDNKSNGLKYSHNIITAIEKLMTGEKKIETPLEPQIMAVYSALNTAPNGDKIADSVVWAVKEGVEKKLTNAVPEAVAQRIVNNSHLARFKIVWYKKGLVNLQQELNKADRLIDQNNEFVVDSNDAISSHTQVNSYIVFDKLKPSQDKTEGELVYTDNSDIVPETAFK